jgi:hypothetical protein
MALMLGMYKQSNWNLCNNDFVAAIDASHFTLKTHLISVYSITLCFP